MNKKKGMILGIIAAGVLGATGVGVYATGQIAQSNSISVESAQNFAYVDAGIAPEEVSVIRTEFDYDYGRFVYEFEFYTNDMEYNYVIDAASGRILEREMEARKKIGSVSTPAKPQTETVQQPKATVTPVPVVTIRPTQNNIAPQTTIDIAQAKETALQHAGLTEGEVVFSKAKQEMEDGRVVYDITFYINGVAEYDYEIDAVTGEIRERSEEPWEAEDTFEVQYAQQQQNSSGGSAPQQGTTQNASSQNNSSGASEKQSTPAQPSAATPAPTAAPAQTAAPTAAPTVAPVQTPVPTAAPAAPQPAPVYYDDDDDWDDAYDDYDDDYDDHDDDHDDYDDHDDHDDHDDDDD